MHVKDGQRLTVSVEQHDGTMKEFVKSRVHDYYWEKDLNCATSTLLVMAEYFGITLQPQLIDAAVGMHGAGGYRAQCGLVEGMLMFIGIFGRQKKVDDEEITGFCREFARKYEDTFSSLTCHNLRPGGFNDDDPPHLCEGLTDDSISHNIQMIETWLTKLS